MPSHEYFPISYFAIVFTLMMCIIGILRVLFPLCITNKKNKVSKSKTNNKLFHEQFQHLSDSKPAPFSGLISFDDIDQQQQQQKRHGTAKTSKIEKQKY